ncbi:hypothetical protein J7643_05380 [bacterium]|nr:hypothetical protein [bacterium]
MRAHRYSSSMAPTALAALLALGAPASAAQATPDSLPQTKPEAASTSPEAPEAGLAVLRGVVGRAVYVALPANKGYAWEWAARGERWLFDAPFRVRVVAEPTPTEIWTFPLARPGRILLDFIQRPVAGPMDDNAATHSIKLWVMTPYEAQQHAPADLRDTLLLR